MRRTRYGKTDDVRLYGNDMQARLSIAGFQVAVSPPDETQFEKDFVKAALRTPRNAIHEVSGFSGRTSVTDHYGAAG